MFRPSINWLFIFIPLTIAFEHLQLSAPLIFFSAALAIIPIAHLITSSTEQLAKYTGDSIGGLLNATCGNLPELIIATVALKAGLHDMVLASLAGAIMANLLLATGVSFLLGGLMQHIQEYNPSSIKLYSSMMMIAVISMMVPSAFNRFFGDSTASEHEQSLNLFLSVILLIAYALYLFFILKTHKDLFTSHSSSEGERPKWTIKRASTSLIGASVMAAFMSEILVGAAEETGSALGMSSLFIGVIFLAIVGGAAESFSAIGMALKNKMDLSIGIALGSSIQIAIFVAPMLVIMSHFIGPHPMNLSFSRALIGPLFLGVIIASMVSGDGRSNWYKGVQLILVYLIIGTMYYFMPEISSKLP